MAVTSYGPYQVGDIVLVHKDKNEEKYWDFKVGEDNFLAEVIDIDYPHMIEYYQIHVKPLKEGEAQYTMFSNVSPSAPITEDISEWL